MKKVSIPTLRATSAGRPQWIEPLAVMVRWWHRMMRTLFFPWVLRMMERTGPVDQPEEIVRLACRGFWRAISPIQNQYELTELLRRVNQLRPARVLEIGTATGGSLFALTRVASPAAHLISIDLPGGPGGGGYHESRVPLYKRFALPGQRLDLIRDDSHSAAVFDKVTSLLNGQSLDFLFLDGDHSYEGVKADFTMYGPFVRPGGLIAFHDTVFIDDVKRFWGEVKLGRESEEIIGPSGSVFGIGLIHQR